MTLTSVTWLKFLLLHRPFAYRRLGSVTHTQEEGVKLYLFEEEYLHRHLEFYVGDLSVSPIYLSVINNQE